MPQSPDLEPHAVLVADMVGYSQRLATQPAETHAAFKDHLSRIFAPCVRRHAGRVIKTTGDGIVAIFVSPHHAERCARSIQHQLRQHDPPQPSLLAPIQYRVAIHFGQITIEQHDVFGLDVNIAIHLQQLSPEGGISISGELFGRLTDRNKRRYEFLGHRYLKNIPVPVAVYRLDATPFTDDARSSLLVPARRDFLTPPPRLGLALYQAFSHAATGEALADMAQDSIMHALSHFRDAFSIAPLGAPFNRASAESPKFRHFLSTDMACEYLLHGSCHVTPRSLILSSHLESLLRKELVWSGKLKVDLESEVEFLDDLIAAQIVAPIVLHVERAEAEPWGTGTHSEHEIRFREAVRLTERGTLGSLDQAKRLLADIINRCGEIGNVCIAMAQAERNHGILLAGDRFVEALGRAEAFAKKALEISPTNPRAHAEFAIQEMFSKKQGSAAETYRHALRLNPFDPIIRADWADCLVNLGRADEALPILENVLAGWPRDRAWVEWALCDTYWALGRPDRIVAMLDRHPDQPYVHRYLAASHARLGNTAQATYHAERVRKHQPGFSTRSWSAVVPFASADSSEEYADYLERAGL